MNHRTHTNISNPHYHQTSQALFLPVKISLPPTFNIKPDTTMNCVLIAKMDFAMIKCVCAMVHEWLSPMDDLSQLLCHSMLIYIVLIEFITGSASEPSKSMNNPSTLGIQNRKSGIPTNAATVHTKKPTMTSSMTAAFKALKVDPEKNPNPEYAKVYENRKNFPYDFYLPAFSKDSIFDSNVNGPIQK